MNEIKKFDVIINSKTLHFKLLEFIPEIKGKVQPMELVFVIEDPDAKTNPIVMNFNKNAAIGILIELRRLIPKIKCFG